MGSKIAVASPVRTSLPSFSSANGHDVLRRRAVPTPDPSPLQGTGIGFDFNAGMSYVETKIDPWNQYGLDFDYDDAKSWRGRLGARVLFPAAMGAFVGAKVFHEFKDDGALVIRSASTDVATIGMPDRGTWVRLEGGLGGVGSKGAMLTVWGDLGDTKAFGARVGFQF